MPILTIEEEDKKYNTKEEREDSRVFRTQEEMKTSTLFHSETHLESIVKQVRGSKWEVTYFKQLTNVNEELSLPDKELPPTVQKYNRINKLILHVQSAIDQAKPSEITGEAIINAGFVPLTHDVFLVTLLGGREAIFYITNVETRSYNLHKIYYVSYKLWTFVDTTPDIYNDILTKVMKEYYYDKDSLLDYGAATILKSDYQDKLNLKYALNDILDYYTNKFITKEKYIHAIPTHTSLYVDTMLTDMLFKIVNRDENELLSKLNILDNDIGKALGVTIFDAILKRDKKILLRCEKDIDFKYTPYTFYDLLNKKMSIYSISFLANKIYSPNEIASINVIENELQNKRPNEYQNPISMHNKHYVMTEAFYNDDKANMGYVERLTMDYLEGKILDSNQVKKMVDEYIYWTTRDQYYLIPIILVLLKDCIANTFKSL